MGKTALMQRFVHKKFSAQYKLTIGVDFLPADVMIDGEITSLQVDRTDIDIDMGHCRTRTLSELRSGILQGCGVLYVGL